MIEKLLVLYQTEPDSGLHAAAEWLLRSGGKLRTECPCRQNYASTRSNVRVRKATAKRTVVRQSQGQTFVVLEAGEFPMGSPISEPDHESDEIPHRRRIGRRFAIAATAVTKEQYQRFLDANPDVQGLRSIDTAVRTNHLKSRGLVRRCALLQLAERNRKDPEECNGVCRGPCVFRTSKGSSLRGCVRRTISWIDRLPLADRGRVGVRLSLGHSDQPLLRSELGVIAEIRLVSGECGRLCRAVARLKPNDFGLFDALGNVLEWCHDRYGKYSDTDINTPLSDDGDRCKVDAKDTRVMRRYRSTVLNSPSAPPFAPTTAQRRVTSTLDCGRPELAAKRLYPLDSVCRRSAAETIFVSYVRRVDESEKEWE